MSLDGFRRVDAFATDAGSEWLRVMSPDELLGVWSANRVSGSPTLNVSRLQYAFLSAKLGEHGGGRGKDPAAAQLWADAWHWWDDNVRGRVWTAPPDGLFSDAAPPRRLAPTPLPAAPSAGDWVDATQQRGWWETDRKAGGGHAARKQAARWAELQRTAAPVASGQLGHVLALVDDYEHKFVVHPAAPVGAPRIGKW